MIPKQFKGSIDQVRLLGSSAWHLLVMHPPCSPPQWIKTRFVPLKFYYFYTWTEWVDEYNWTNWTGVLLYYCVNIPMIRHVFHLENELILKCLWVQGNERRRKWFSSSRWKHWWSWWSANITKLSKIFYPSYWNEIAFELCGDCSKLISITANRVRRCSSPVNRK